MFIVYFLNNIVIWSTRCCMRWYTRTSLWPNAHTTAPITESTFSVWCSWLMPLRNPPSLYTTRSKTRWIITGSTGGSVRYVFKCMRWWIVYWNINACVRVHVLACACSCAYVCVCVCARARAHTCACACVRVLVRKCMCGCVSYMLLDTGDVPVCSQARD